MLPPGFPNLTPLTLTDHLILTSTVIGLGSIMCADTFLYLLSGHFNDDGYRGLPTCGQPTWTLIVTDSIPIVKSVCPNPTFRVVLKMYMLKGESRWAIRDELWRLIGVRGAIYRDPRSVCFSA